MVVFILNMFFLVLLRFKRAKIFLAPTNFVTEK